MHRIIPLLLIVLGSCRGLAAADLAAALRASPPTGGVLVQVGAHDAALASALPTPRAFLVCLLAADDAQADAIRAQIRAAGLAPWTLVDTWQGGQLPFARRGIDILALPGDGDAGRPSADEIRRAVVPGGAVWTAAAGGWTVATVPWDDALADWTHFTADAHGTGVSAERLGAPATSLKWISGTLGADVRMERGWLVSAERRVGGLSGRRAFTGVPLWHAANRMDDPPTQLAVGGGLAFHFPGPEGGPAQATDLRTGEPRATFSGGVTLPARFTDKTMAVPVQVVLGDTLVQAFGKDLWALDAATGAVRWHVVTASPVVNAIGDPASGKVWCIESEEPNRKRMRWGKHKAVAITCVDRGTVAWRADRIAGEELSDLILDGSRLIGFDPTTNLGDDGDGDVFAFDPATGRQLWRQNFDGSYNKMLNNAVIWRGSPWVWGPFNNLWNITDGGITVASVNKGYNQRCTRLSGCQDFLVFGFTSWYGADGSYTQTTLTRSECSLPAYVAHGMAVFGYNLACTCHNGLRGVLALQPPEPFTPVADDGRVRQLRAATASTEREVAAEGMPAREWRPERRLFWLPDATTPAVEAAGLTLVADTDRHRLIARRGGAEVWRWIADGRIYGAPAIVRDAVFVASADGRVTCLDLASGAARWSFLAAPARRLLVAYGQLESAWPVYQVAAHDGLIWCSAGRHAEIDGGIWLWALDPASGAVRWRAVIHTPPATVRGGDRAPGPAFDRAYASRAPLNGGFAVGEGGRLEFQSPQLTKFGSSESQFGYFVPGADSRQGHPTTGAPKREAFPVDRAAWQGRTLSVADLVPPPSPPAKK